MGKASLQKDINDLLDMDGFVPEGTKDMVNNNTSFADTSAGKAVLGELHELKNKLLEAQKSYEDLSKKKAEEMRQALDAQKRLLDQRLKNMERQRDQAQETMDRKMKRLQREMEEREANLKKLEKESTKSEKQNAELKKKLRKLEKQQDAWKARSSDKGKSSSGTSKTQNFASRRAGNAAVEGLEVLMVVVGTRRDQSQAPYDLGVTLKSRCGVRPTTSMQSTKRKATASPRRGKDDESYAPGSSLSPSAKSRARSAINHAIFGQRCGSFQEPEQDDRIFVNEAGQDDQISVNEIEQVQGLCVLTRVSDDMDILDSSYLIAKSINDETLTKLEWAWGMPYWSLNVDTHFNIQTLSAAVHKFFDREENGWFWLPERSIIAALQKAYRIDKKHRCDVNKAWLPSSSIGGITQADLPLQLYKNQHIFNYRFIATEGMKSCCAIRMYNGSYTSVNPLAFTQHAYPFSQLRQFKLNILPHFVIFNTGMKLDKILGGSTSFDNIYSKFDFSEPDTAAHIAGCLDLYRLWMSGSPSDTFTNSLDSSQAPSQTSNHDSSASRPTRTSQRTHQSRASAPPANPDDSAGTGDELSPNDSASNVDGPVDYDEEGEDEDWTGDDEVKLMHVIEEWAEDVWRHSFLDEDSASNSSTGGMALVDPSEEQPPPQSCQTTSHTQTVDELAHATC
ncbi:hypothetical protein EYR36_002158 [Pleurotus pulmonarius]|nr:hypothetical protein EYR36_002158 [Pleurotus pulmonarius]